MITITSKVMGQTAQVLEDFEGRSVADLLARLGLTGNYTFNVGGLPANADTQLANGSYVVFAPSVKGAAKKKVTKRATSTNLNKAPLKIKAKIKTVKKA